METAAKVSMCLIPGYVLLCLMQPIYMLFWWLVIPGLLFLPLWHFLFQRRPERND